MPAHMALTLYKLSFRASKVPLHKTRELHDDVSPAGKQCSVCGGASSDLYDNLHPKRSARNTGMGLTLTQTLAKSSILIIQLVKLIL